MQISSQAVSTDSSEADEGLEVYFLKYLVIIWLVAKSPGALLLLIYSVSTH